MTRAGEKVLTVLITLAIAVAMFEVLAAATTVVTYLLVRK